MTNEDDYVLNLAAKNVELKYRVSELQAERDRLLRENEAMKGVVDASIAIVQAHYIDATCKDCTGETGHVNQLLEKIEQLQKLPEFNPSQLEGAK